MGWGKGRGVRLEEGKGWDGGRVEVGGREGGGWRKGRGVRG